MNDQGVISANQLARFSPDRAPEPYFVHQGDVLLKVRGGTPCAGTVHRLPPRAMASNHFFILRTRPDILLPDYLAWYLNSPEAQAHMSRHSQGRGTVRILPRMAIESVEIPLPAIPIQQHIASLHQLQLREQALMAQIQEKREVWIQRICLRAIESTPQQIKERPNV
jgi:hypothetical protein